MTFSPLGLFPFYQLATQSIRLPICGSVARRSQTMKRTWLKVWGAVGLTLCVLLLAACGKPDYMSNPRPILHTTISSDGQMIATLLNAGTDEQRLRVMRLDTNEGWQDVKAPRFTHSIQFGLTGKQLLLTHHISDVKRDKLVMMDLDNLGAALVEIYSADKLAFPEQVSASEYVVRKCTYEKTKTYEVLCKKSADQEWVLIQNRLQTMVLAPWQIALRYGGPNIVGRGVFWLSHSPDIDKNLPHLVYAVALPGGEVPKTSKASQRQDTTQLACDSTANRCLRQFISNWLKPGKEGFTYIFHLEILHADEKCLVEGVVGTSDHISIAPDGNSAIMSLAATYDGPRHVVVMKFDKDKCSAKSVQHINF